MGSDYAAIDQILSFAPGASLDCFIFIPIPDNLTEPTENVEIMASSASTDIQFTQTGSQASIDIIDDDGEYV